MNDLKEVNELQSASHERAATTAGRALNLCFGAALLFLIQGCAGLAPGHGSMTAPTGIPSDNRSEDGWAKFSAPPESIIVPITPEVIRTLNQMHPIGGVNDLSAYLIEPAPYTIGAGDVVGVVVYDHPELMPSSGAVISQQVDPTGISAAPGLIVNSAGEISFPYVGRINLKGLTEVQATELLGDRLRQYIKEPQVSLRIQSFRSRRAYVEGEVRQPGMQVFTDLPMSLAEAINRAGGITPNGDRSNVSIMRDGQLTQLDLPALQAAGINMNTIMLKSGDTIQVKNREDKKVYVTGEISRPQPVLMRDGKLSLSQALGETSGINPTTSDAGQIYVIRRNSDGSPGVFHLDARNPMMLALADGFELQARDVVYIDPVPLVRWNRVISLIVPSASVVNYGSQVNSR